jgi:MFS transporter, FHS family, glucose/mannose:H+ symporter
MLRSILRDPVAPGGFALLGAGIATFVSMGIGQALYGPALPSFVRTFGLTGGAEGWLLSAHWIGCLIGVGAMYALGARISPRAVVLVMAAGSAGVALAPAWGLVVLAALVYGAGYGMATAVFNPRVLGAFGRGGPSMLSLLNATFGIGAILAPLLFVALGQERLWTFGLAAAFSAGVALFAGPAGQVGAPDAPAAGARFHPHAGILIFGALAIGLEAVLIGLGPTALIAAGRAEDAAARDLSAFFVMFLVVRLALVVAASRLPSLMLFSLALGLTAILSTWAIWTDAPGLVYAAMGAAVGTYFPGYYVTASALMGSDLRVPPTIIAAGIVGGILAPLALAPAMPMLGERGFFVVIAGITATMTLALLLLRRTMAR